MCDVVFRVDASARLGIGHLVRSLTLADELRRRGAGVRFVCNRLSLDHAAFVRSRGAELLELAPDAAGAQEVDAECTAAALAGRPAHWMVVDNYALGAPWESAMRARGARILAIDDLADRDHECDVLLDQNYLPDGESRYRGRVPQQCVLLIGPRFALLAPEYRAHREGLAARPRRPSRLMVFFGGTDPQHLTERAFEALSTTELQHLAVDVVCTGDEPRRRALERRAALRPGASVYGSRPHLADLMARADLALGGGGTTSWARICLGLRSLVVCMADNQREVVRWLDARGLARLIGDAASVTAADIRSAVLEEVQRDRPAAILAEGMQLCDGLGAARTADVLLAGSAGAVAVATRSTNGH